MKFYDISLEIRESMLVYPGNPAPSIHRYASIPRDKVNESLIELGSHTGTHVDSKLHIHMEGEGTATLPLDSFYGRSQVINLGHVKNGIHKDDLEGHPIRRGDIILLKTLNSRRGYRRFDKRFVHVKLDAAEFLVNAGVKTLGFDYLSAKRFGGDEEVHEMLINNLTLFEGLNLAGVPEGEYTFIGLPLRINCDGAPARAVLIKDANVGVSEG